MAKIPVVFDQTDKPIVFMETPDPNKHTSISGGNGMRSGTVVPHAGPDLDQSKAAYRNLLVTDGDSKSVADLDLSKVTPAMSRIAYEWSMSAGTTPEEQSSLYFKKLNELINGPQKQAVAQPRVVAAPEPEPDRSAFRPTQYVQPPSLQPPVTALPVQHVEAPLAPAPAQIPMELPGADAVLQQFMIPNLYAQPTKPTAKVRFDLGDAGRHTANYHWVLQEGNGLFLIFDSRFEWASPYQPPDLGTSRPIRVELLNAERETYECFSCDFVLNFGTFNITILLLAPPDPAMLESDSPGFPG